MKTIIAGTRTATREQTLAAIGTCPWRDRISRVLCGAAQGADTYGETWAYAVGLPVDYYEADWKAHGKAAGPIRNQKMADNAEALILAWDGQSKGSADMLRRAKAKGLLIYVFNYEAITVAA